MKISTNFVRPLPRLVQPLTIALWTAALVCAAAAWLLLRDAANLRADLPHLRQRLANVQAGSHAVVTGLQPAPSAQVLAETRNRVAAVNAATQTRGITTLALLTELENLLPAQAWLVSLHHRATDGEVMLIVAAASPAPLSNFLLKLERAPQFAEVLLLRESQAAGGNPNVQYEIHLKVRS
jgi:Tfp pilus assembly protein PilN